MDFALSETASRLRDELLAFMDEKVLPAEPVYRKQLEESGDPHFHPPVMEDLKADAKKRGLWNLFLPHKTQWTEGLSNLDYSPLCEVMGRSALASEATNCAAPDTGNMEILTMFGTPEQQEQWLHPLLEGEIRSAFAMTEPAVASSDATNIECRIESDGDDYVINGRKWWISGAASSRCKILIVMGKTDPNAPRHLQQSMVLVPMDTPGVINVRSLPVFGYQDVEGHCELVFDNVRVPKTNLLGEEGGGFAIAQARLGPGTHPSLHAHDRRGRARARHAVRTRHEAHRVRQVAGRAGRDPDMDRRCPHQHRPVPPVHALHRVADGQRRQQGRPHRDLRHQGGRSADGARDHRPRHPGARRRRYR